MYGKACCQFSRSASRLAAPKRAAWFPSCAGTTRQLSRKETGRQLSMARCSGRVRASPWAEMPPPTTIPCISSRRAMLANTRPVRWAQWVNNSRQTGSFWNARSKNSGPVKFGQPVRSRAVWMSETAESSRSQYCCGPEKFQ